MSSPNAQALRLQPEDYLAVLLDLLLHGRETADLVKTAPHAFGEAAALCCADIDGGTDRLAQDLAQRLWDFFSVAPEDAPLPAAAPFGQWAESLHRATKGTPRFIGFLTSGSTGKPALQLLPFIALEEEVRILAARLPLKRVCSVMPRYHCFGFVYGVLLPRATNLPRRAFMPLPTVEMLAYLRPGDLLVGFPFFFDALVRMQTDLRGVMPLTAGSPCPPGLADALLQAGAAGVREIYGASELSAIGFRHMAQPGEAVSLPFTLLPQWTRDGNILIRRFADGSADKPAPLPDSLDWRNERDFAVVARHDKAVQVGGRNVYPDRVREVLESHPEVARCRVRLMRPEEGWRLKAFVVPAEVPANARQATRLRASLLAWCRERLAPESVPKAVTFGSALPYNAYGKDADWG